MEENEQRKPAKAEDKKELLFIALLVLCLIVAIIYGAGVTTRYDEVKTELANQLSGAEEQQGIVAQEAADKDEIIARMESDARTKDETIAQLEADVRAKDETIAQLASEAQTKDITIAQLEADAAELMARQQSLTEEDIEQKVEERYPELVAEITRLKALGAAQLGEALLQEETDAANEG